MKKIILLLLLIVPNIAFGKYDVLDEKIEKFCFNHDMANDTYEEFNESFKIRCTLIGQAQIRFESKQCKIVIGNNCFGFRSPTIKKEWETKYGVVGLKNGFLVFKDKTSSIKFWVDRFYKIERYKTVHQIINGGSYISPVDGEVKTFNGFTMTIEHRPSYTKYIKTYYKNNIKYLQKYL